MDKIVETPLKVDFHIHSAFSKFKDNEVIKDSTIENLPVLYEKLRENKIDCISITDHDVFSLDMYNAVKEWEKQGKIKKVFPGVEFSVGFEADDGRIKQVHVVAIFNDENLEGIKRLSEILPVSKVPNYDSGTSEQFFRESTFKDILARIGLDVILIAHQKGSLTSKTPSKKDANILGKKHFNEFLNMGYFEAYEFKSPKNGIFNNLFKNKINKERKTELLRFWTGSDCHNWSCYPNHDESEDVEGFQWTYLKCLPTFFGLKLAATDNERIRLNDKFFSDAETLNNIHIKEDGKDINIPLSKGINVIIGDNSVGKSALLHSLTSFAKFDKTNESLTESLARGYRTYFANAKIEVFPIPNNINYTFNYQGEIRKEFESGNSFPQNFINDLYPSADPDANKYIDFAEKLLKPIIEKMRLKETISQSIATLPLVTLFDRAPNNKNLSVTLLSKDKQITDAVSSLSKTGSNLTKALESVKKIDPNSYLDEEDIKLLRSIHENLLKLSERIDVKEQKAKFTQMIYDSVKKGVGDFKQALNTYLSGEEKKYNDEIQKREELAANIGILIANIKRYNFLKEHPEESTIIKVEERLFGDFKFIKRFKCKYKYVDFKYINDVLDSLLVKGHNPLFPIDEFNVDMLGKLIKETLISSNLKQVDPISILETLAKDKIKKDFALEKAILSKNTDFTETFSRGLNSSNYFEILGFDEDEAISLYIVDQPEDDISQTAIHNVLIPSLKRLSHHKQIIMVTHNPQLVVNLDADNVIFISKKDSGELNFQSGALEYKDESTDILSIVANHLDGGLSAIRERLTRYVRGTTNE